MKNRVPAIFLAIVAALFFAGIAELLHMRFSRGDVYPVYSTYRADPLGTRALYESLQLLPGIRAQRWLRDIEKLPKNFHGTLILAGMDRRDWESMPAAEASRLDAIIRGGARVIVAFTAGFTERPKPKRETTGDDSDAGAGDQFDAVAIAAHRSHRKTPASDARDKRDESDANDKNDASDANAAALKFVDAGAQWDIKLNVYKIRPDKNGLYPAAQRSADAPRSLPAKLEWMSELFFEPQPDSSTGSAGSAGSTGSLARENARAHTATHEFRGQAARAPSAGASGASETSATSNTDWHDWRTLYTRQGRPVLIERQFGGDANANDSANASANASASAGALILAADSFFLSNEALQRARATALLAWLVDAPNGGGLVIFDEWHLGMEEDTGIAVLARRYGLAGAAFVAALFVALWAWRSMALFVPPAPEPEQAETSYDPTAGLEALLRRSIPRAQLAQACLAEWRKSATASDARRADAALAALGSRATQTETYNALLKAQRRTPAAAKPRPVF